MRSHWLRIPSLMYRDYPTHHSRTDDANNGPKGEERPKKAMLEDKFVKKTKTSETKDIQQRLNTESYPLNSMPFIFDIRVFHIENTHYV